jgi:hypothetical protein
MKKALLVSLVVFPLGLGCAAGEISGGGSFGAGAAGSTGASGTVGGPGPGTAGAGSSSGAAGATGAPGAIGMAGATGGAGSAGGACGSAVIPADVAAVIVARCVACHGNPPLAGVPTSLTTYAELAAPSMSDPAKSVAALALARMQDPAKPMPPSPLARATATDLAAFQRWVGANLSGRACPDSGASDGGGAIDAGPIADPYNTPPVCTSKTTWTRGNAESPDMNPGMTCISCHTTMNKGPKLTIGGTIFPTAHEPDLCNGGNSTTGARVVIVGADGKTITLTPSASGNFRYEGALAKPYSAKVTYLGRERGMIEKQTSGDCNSCHTQAGIMMAPGRIMLP